MFTTDYTTNGIDQVFSADDEEEEEDDEDEDDDELYVNQHLMYSTFKYFDDELLSLDDEQLELLSLDEDLLELDLDDELEDPSVTTPIGNSEAGRGI